MKTYRHTTAPLWAALMSIALTAPGCAHQSVIPQQRADAEHRESRNLTIAQTGSGVDRAFVLCWNGSCPKRTPKWMAASMETMDQTTVAKPSTAQKNALELNPGAPLPELWTHRQLLHFEPGTSALSPAARRTLQQLHPALQAASAIVLVGHTDASGSPAFNQRLAHWRAKAVKSYLLAADPTLESRIAVQSAGSRSPIAGNDSATGRRLNRRTEVVIRSSSENAGATL